MRGLSVVAAATHNAALVETSSEAHDAAGPATDEHTGLLPAAQHPAETADRAAAQPVAGAAGVGAAGPSVWEGLHTPPTPIKPITPIAAATAVTAAGVDMPASGVAGTTGDGGWQTLEGPFIAVLCSNVPQIAKDMRAAPHAHLADGCLDLVVIPGSVGACALPLCPVSCRSARLRVYVFDAPLMLVFVLCCAGKCKLLSMFLGFENGEHVHDPSVRYLKVRAMELRPDPFSGDFDGYLNVDGETLEEFLPVRVCVVPAAWRVFRLHPPPQGL